MSTAPPARRRGLPIVVFIGGCVGGYARYALVDAWGSGALAFPAATLLVNLVGAFVLGWLLALLAGRRRSTAWRLLVGTGFCGGLTTFSSMVVSTDRLLGHGRPGVAIAYLAASTVGALGTAGLGLLGGQALARRLRRAGPP